MGVRWIRIAVPIDVTQVTNWYYARGFKFSTHRKRGFSPVSSFESCGAKAPLPI